MSLASRAKRHNRDTEYINFALALEYGVTGIPFSDKSDDTALSSAGSFSTTSGRRLTINTKIARMAAISVKFGMRWYGMQSGQSPKIPCRVFNLF